MDEASEGNPQVLEQDEIEVRCDGGAGSAPLAELKGERHPSLRYRVGLAGVVSG